MTDEDFCKMVSSYDGEEIDKVEQLESYKFSGRELKEFIEHCLEYKISKNRGIIIIGSDEQGKAELSKIIEEEKVFRITRIPDLGSADVIKNYKGESHYSKKRKKKHFINRFK